MDHYKERWKETSDTYWKDSGQDEIGGTLMNAMYDALKAYKTSVETSAVWHPGTCIGSIGGPVHEWKVEPLKAKTKPMFIKNNRMAIITKDSVKEFRRM
jgi:hypothetical protein